MMSYQEARLYRFIVTCACVTWLNTVGVALGWWGDGLVTGHIVTACIAVVGVALTLAYFIWTHQEQ